MTKPARILFISNGHGEDSIAVKIIGRLRRIGGDRIEIHAWPMVGEGRPYRHIEIPVAGPYNLLPSCGFATLSLKWMWRDLKAGWIRTHLKQIKGARHKRNRYPLIVAVGDVVAIAAAVLSRTPFFFVGCAKSSYYSSLHGYTRLEKYLLRKHCILTFPRDRLTVKELDRAGVTNEFVGNPMMDDLKPRGRTFKISPDTQVIGLLPGSRTDAEDNVLHLLEALSEIEPAEFPAPLHGLFAPPDSLDMDRIVVDVKRGKGGGWKIEHHPPREEGKAVGHIALKLVNDKGLKAWFVKGGFADVLHRSTVVVGVAGTANEQAIGLGKPLITFPTRGIMGPQYVRMKMKLFGPSALEVEPRPQAIAAAAGTLLKEKETRRQMAEAGRERMGGPGASEAMARRIYDYLNSMTGETAVRRG